MFSDLAPVSDRLVARANPSPATPAITQISTEVKDAALQAKAAVVPVQEKPATEVKSLAAANAANAKALAKATAAVTNSAAQADPKATAPTVATVPNVQVAASTAGLIDPSSALPPMDSDAAADDSDASSSGGSASSADPGAFEPPAGMASDAAADSAGGVAWRD